MTDRRRCSALHTLFVGLVLLAGLHCTASAERSSIIALVCADGDLTRTGQDYARRLTEAAAEGGWTLALQIDNGSEHPVRRLLTAGSEAFVARPPAGGANSADPDALVDLFDWAREAAPAERYIVVVYGHGSSASGRAWDGSQVASWPALAIDATAGGDPLQPAELAGAIEKGLGRKVDIVILDCCYGASLEVAWDLQLATDLLIASPGRVASDGLPWGSLLGRVSAAGPTTEIAQSVIEQHQGTTGLRLPALGSLKAALRALCAELIGNMPEYAPALTLAVSQSERWGAEREMCDLRALCVGLAATEGPVANAALQTVAALDRCAISGMATVPFAIGPELQSVRFPVDGFTRTSSWGEMMEVYRNRLEELMHRTLDDRRHDGAATCQESPPAMTGTFAASAPELAGTTCGQEEESK
jgi:hypothetical protein